MSVRDLWVRVQVGSTLVAAAAPVRIQQQLEGAVTMVAEVALAGSTPALATNSDVTIHHVNRNNAPDPNYDSRQLFAGIVNRIGGVGAPHGVTLSCTGALAKLRRTRTTDYVMKGKTDIQVVKDVLTFCGIPYTPSEIGGWNYTLRGVVEDTDAATAAGPIWHAGTSGAAIIGELDRVFACATIELGDGRVVRFPYSRAPYRYPDPVTYAKTFTRGQAGVSFYGNERDRGDLDQIMNYWVVRGVSFTWGEGHDYAGCQSTYLAVANSDHAALGPGVDVGPNEFSSDLIDSEELAKAIAIRLMQWNNREPDTIRIQCGNDARIAPGQLILVRDPSYGIDLASQSRYLVTAVTRDGDTMLLDGVGGPTGVVGSVHSQLTLECNGSQSDIGTDPPAFGVPDPVIPDIPGLGDMVPDLPPIEDPTDPDAETLYSLKDCTDYAGGLHDPDYVVGGPWREIGTWAWDLEEQEDGSGFQNKSADLVSNSGILVYNTTPIGTTKTPDNDFRFGKNEPIIVSLTVTLNYPDTQFQVRLVGEGGTGTPVELAAIWYTEPGFETLATTPPFSPFTHPGGHWGLTVDSENSTHGLTGIPLGYIDGDNGGLGGSPIAPGSSVVAWVAFDPSPEYQTIQTAGDFSTLKVDPRSQTAPAIPDLHYPDCTHTAHLLWIRAVSPSAAPPAGMTWFDKPLVSITAIGLGRETCVANPEFIPPAVEDF